ncbi:MAG: transglutaminase domain-containing protein [Vallitaleaceae bacterium]|nr:transglutaminase domain-containing protein [Vallitaleaceae bacterium]
MMKAIFGFIFLSFFLILSSKEVQTQETKTPSYSTYYDMEKIDQGIFGVYYYAKDPKKMKLMITKNDIQYVYNVYSEGEVVYYPLQLGDGSYNVSLYENVSGTKYRKVMTQSLQLNLTDDYIVFLQSIQEINFNESDQSIIFTMEMMEEALATKNKKYNSFQFSSLTDREKINTIYSFILEAIEYDFEKIKKLDYSYLPDNDKTLEIGSGICYDYSSLFASMLRWENIPTKMVKGYAKDSEVYHAWNEVFLTSTKEWVVVDTTFDAYAYQNNRDYDFEKSVDEYNKVKEY